MKINPRILPVLGMLAAVSVVLMYFVSVPILPAAPHLKWDAGDVPIILATVIFGVPAAVLVSCAKSFLIFLFAGNPFGVFMNFAATTTLAVVFGLSYHRWFAPRVVWPGLLSALAVALIMIPANLIIVPLEFGVPLREIWAAILPIYIPFNLIKVAFSTVLYYLASQVLKPVWNQMYEIASSDPAGPGRQMKDHTE